MREVYLKMMKELNDAVIEMGRLIEKAICHSVNALEKQDKNYCDIVFSIEKEINQKEKDIENLCIKLILHQQPVASDLHKISATLKMITDMERIGDGATDIANIALRLMQSTEIKELNLISQMATETVKMVNLSIDAYTNMDLATVNLIYDNDDIVDELFEQVKIELSTLLLNNNENLSVAIDLLLVSKYFEKIGDHAVNIANWVQFAITGHH